MHIYYYNTTWRVFLELASLTKLVQVVDSVGNTKLRLKYFYVIAAVMFLAQYQLLISKVLTKYAFLIYEKM